MSLEQELNKIKEAEKEWNKIINNEVILEREIEDVARITANILENKPFAPFEIDKREFIVIATTYNNEKNNKCIQLVAREKTKIETSTAKIIKADFELDTNYSKKENLITGIKALLGHITGLIKPETLD